MAWNQLPARAGRIFGQWAMYSAQAESRIQENNSTDWKKLLDNENTWPIKVWDVAGNKLVTIPLEQYVAGVVAAEMPASYHLEALKAQAAAARTRAVCQAAAFSGKGCANHPGADICTDSTHCQAYLNESERAEKWGASAKAYEARIFRAVMETKGAILTYNGEPITVMYHAISGGHTEDVQAVFSQSLPYLIGVESKGEESNPKYQTTQSFSHQEASDLLNKAFPGANISPDTAALQIAITERTSTGRAAKVQVGDREVLAKDFRAALKLNSTLFTITATESSLIFSEKGYGHGVGMSQAGANAMAASGSTWKDILMHYYTGIQITALPAK
jgi:stage II sporulation protein D